MESAPPAYISPDGTYNQPTVSAYAPQPDLAQPAPGYAYGVPPQPAPGYAYPHQTGYAPQPTPGYAPAPAAAPAGVPARALEDQSVLSMVLFIVGFFCGITWIIGWCMFGTKSAQDQFTPATYRFGRLSRGFFICCLVFTIIAIVGSVLGLALAVL